MGKPAACLHNDFMEEIVQDGVNGFIVHDDPEEIMEKFMHCMRTETCSLIFREDRRDRGRLTILTKSGKRCMRFMRTR